MEESMSRVESGAKEGTVTVKMLVCCLLFAGYSFGQTSGGDSHKSTLIALERMWDRAQIAHDASALLNVVDDNFVNTEWDGSVANKDQFLAAVKNPLVKVEVSQIETTQVTLHGNTAIVTGTYRTKGNRQGKPYDHFARFTDTWIFQENRWQCIAAHASLIQ
jgi:ketosteroid isomerase-like protein